MNRLSWCLVLSIVTAQSAFAGGPCSGVRGGCGRSVYRGSYAPNSSSFVYPIDDPPPVKTKARKKYRSTAKDYARTRVWHGTGSASEETPATDPGSYARVDHDILPTVTANFHPSTPSVPAKYVAVLKNHRRRPIVFYEKVGDGYRLHFTDGGSVVYEADMIERFETVEEPKSAESNTPMVYSSCAGLPDEAVIKEAFAGDAIRLVGGDRIWLTGVKAPHPQHGSQPGEYFGQEARDFTEELLAAEKVRLSCDQDDAAIPQGKPGHLLAYVFRDRDNLDVNAELIKQGYARVTRDYPFSRLDEFLAYEAEARVKKLGLWADQSNSSQERLSTFPTKVPTEPQNALAVDSSENDVLVYVTETGKKYHREGCSSLRRSKIAMPLSKARDSYSPCHNCQPPE